MSEWNATYYKNHADSQHSAGLKFIENIPLTGSEAILDIGCGDGRITKALAEKVASGRVVGLDASSSMIKEARQDYGHLPNLSFVEERAEDLSFEDPFDVIVSFSALHWVKNHPVLLKNLHKILKPNGQMYFSMLAGRDKRIEAVFNRPPWNQNREKASFRLTTFSPEKYRAWLGDAGFTRSRVEIIEIPAHFATVNEIKEAFLVWLPYASGFSGEKVEKMAMEVAESVAEGAVENITVQTPILYVEAYKEDPLG